jgi:hypothetical protein
MTRRLPWVVAALLIVPTASFGQIAAEADVAGTIDDNLDNNALKVSDYILTTTLRTGYDLEAGSTAGQVYYIGSLRYFGSIAERTYQTHSAGALATIAAGEEDQSLFVAGGSASSRIGRASYSFYDTREYAVYANARTYVTESLIGKGGYQYRAASYPGMGMFDFGEHYLFLQATASLPTRSTLILQADLGVKTYAGSADSGVTQASLAARIGQPLFDATGLSLAGTLRSNLRNAARMAVSPDGLYLDQEYFDEQYAHAGPAVEVALTHIVSTSVTAAISAAAEGRTYTGRPAYDLDWNVVSETRKDSRMSASARIDWRFESAGFAIGFAYDFIANRSNDEFYDYTANTLTAGFSLAP